jgi:hypothetical protein
VAQVVVVMVLLQETVLLELQTQVVAVVEAMLVQILVAPVDLE